MTEPPEIVPVIVSRLETSGPATLQHAAAPNESIHALVGGLRGTMARYFGAELAICRLDGDQHAEVRELLPHLAGVGASVTADMYVADFLFNAWSSIETLVFAANGVGFALDAAGFAKPGPRTSPHDVIADVEGRAPRRAAAYTRTLTTFSGAMRQHEEALNQINDQHVVSKHRHATTPSGEVDLSHLNAVPDEIRSMLVPLAFRHASWRKIRLTARPKAVGTGPSATIPLDEVVANWRTALRAALVGLETDFVRLRG